MINTQPFQKFVYRPVKKEDATVIIIRDFLDLDESKDNNSKEIIISGKIIL